MKISEVHIKGFRNFKDARLSFNNHTAIMGFNDIGKTNLIYAIRLLLDKNISESEMELTEADFFVYEETNNIEIVIKFDEVTEDFVLAKLREFVSDNGVIYLKYTISKNFNQEELNYSWDKFSIKDSLTLIELETNCYDRNPTHKELILKYTNLEKKKRKLEQDIKNI